MTLTPPEISISADIKVGKQPPVEDGRTSTSNPLKFTDQTASPPLCHLAPLQASRLFVAAFFQALAHQILALFKY